MSFTDNNDDYIEAAQWLEQFAETKIDDVTAQRFKKWLEGNSRRKGIFNRMVSTWQDPALTAAVRGVHEQSLLKSRWRFNRIWHGVGVAGAVAACCLVVVLLHVWRLSNATPSVLSLQVNTRIAQQLDQNLADGSLIEAAAKTRVQIEYSPHLRKVFLTRGAANFKVAKDKQRPFEVTIDSTTVVAVGTEFTVDKTVDGTDVTVFEGAVEVMAGGAAVLVSAGEKIRVAGGKFTAVKRFDLKRRIDWRSGWIEIEDESLRYLIEQLNRHAETPIDIAEKSLENRRVAGRFRLKDTRQVLTMLSSVYGFDLIHEHQKIIIKNRPTVNTGV